jgi:hypothetical protein
MKVIPINFMTEHKNMLSHLHLLINKEYLAIPKDYDKLIISLRTAYANEYSLDKEQTSYDDSLDALRLSCKMYPLKDET